VSTLIRREGRLSPRKEPEGSQAANLCSKQIASLCSQTAVVDFLLSVFAPSPSSLCYNLSSPLSRINRTVPVSVAIAMTKDVTTVGEQEVAPQWQGTDTDRHDMSVLGRAQQLRVRLYLLLTDNCIIQADLDSFISSATFNSSPFWALDVLSFAHGRFFSRTFRSALYRYSQLSARLSRIVSHYMLDSQPFSI